MGFIEQARDGIITRPDIKLQGTRVYTKVSQSRQEMGVYLGFTGQAINWRVPRLKRSDKV